MRFIPSLLFFILTAYTAFSGDKPEAIPFKTSTIKPIDWYSDQARLWKETLQISPSPEGWINYYLATKYSQAPTGQLKEIQEQVSSLRPRSFEALVIESWTLGYSEDALKRMQQAFELKPDNPVTYASMVLLHEFRLDAENRQAFSTRLSKTREVSSSLLSYSYNVLMSLEQDAILFTEGDNTTVPLFLLQDVYKIRQDVRILNLDMMLGQTYRERKLAASGLGLEDLTLVESETENRKSLCGILPKQNPSRKFYYALTLSKNNIADIKDQLYVVGLASQISSQRFDNITFLRENLENRFLLDHLTVDFDGESKDAAGKVLSANYLVPMLLLSEHYQQTGETENLKQWESLIFQLAKEHGKSTVVQNFLNREKIQPEPFIAANLNIKALEGSMRHIKSNIHALKNEVTNDDYNFFLKYLIDNKKNDLYEICNYDLSQYAEPALSFMKGYHSRPLSKKERAGYPVVNISYEGAVAYCDWLTEQYNHDEKRKYKKVKFRLPTLNEWRVAALGYKKLQSWILEENSIEMIVPKNEVDEICKGCETQVVSFSESDIRYPWFGSFNYRNKPLNRRGCALANFKWPESQKPCIPGMPTPDGWIAMAPVESYFENGMGLSDVVGNVAEMTIEKGKACGGSWNHFPEESTINSINEYKGPDAAIGFRVFMEVIEQ